MCMNSTQTYCFSPNLTIQKDFPSPTWKQAYFVKYKKYALGVQWCRCNPSNMQMLDTELNTWLLSPWFYIHVWYNKTPNHLCLFKQKNRYAGLKWSISVNDKGLGLRPSILPLLIKRSVK